MKRYEYDALTQDVRLYRRALRLPYMTSYNVPYMRRYEETTMADWKEYMQ